MLANLLDPDAGRILIADHEILKLAEAVTGRSMTYIGYPAQIFAGTVADNLFFGLKYRPQRPPPLEGPALEQRQRELEEAKRAGNLALDVEADWLDYAAAGLEGPEAVAQAAVRALTMVCLDWDVYQMGLRGTVDPETQPELAGQILEARRAMRERLHEPARPPGRGVRSSATTATPAWPRTCCSAPRSARSSTSRTSPPTLTSSGSSPRPGSPVPWSRSASSSPARWSTCSPICRPTTSISVSSASSAPTTCPTIGPWSPGSTRPSSTR